MEQAAIADAIRIGTDASPLARPVRLTREQRRAHTHIMGGSGRGKSYFLELLIRQAFDDPDSGLCLLDPHGSLYRPLVRYLAEERPELADRVVLFDPGGGHEHMPGFNPINAAALEAPAHALTCLVDACLKAWGQDKVERTPRIARWLENIFAPIIVNDLTLVETIPLMSTSRHSDKRGMLLSALEHDMFQEEWAEFEAMTSTMRGNLLEGASNRLRKFLSSDVVRRIIGQKTHGLDLEEIVAGNKILLVNLAPNRRLDRGNANLLGVLLINELFSVAMDRDPDGSPPPFHLVIDEFAQFITPNVANILDECRKYGLFLTLAHQHLAQLRKEDEWLYASVLTNCHNRFVFGGLSVEDATILAEQVHSGFLELKQIKHETWQTKFRPVEERRRLESLARAISRSRTQTDSASSSESHTRSQDKGITDSKGTTDTVSHQHTQSTQESLSESRGENRSTGGQKGRSRNQEQSRSATSNWQDGESEQHGYSRQTNRSETHASGSNFTHSGSEQRTYPPGSPTVLAQGASDSAGFSDQQSFGSGSSEGITGGSSRSHSEGGAVTEGMSVGQGENESENWGRGDSVTVGKNRGFGRSDAHGQARSVSEGHAVSERYGVSHSESTQHGSSEARMEGDSESRGESLVPFHRMEEFQEASHTFWSLAEIKEMLMGEMKEQPVGMAVMKLGSRPPQKVRIDALPPSSAPQDDRQRRVAALYQAVVAAHPEVYADQREIDAEIETRQLRIFGEVLRLDLRAAPLTGSVYEGEAREIDPDAAEEGRAALPARPTRRRAFDDDD